MYEEGLPYIYEEMHIYFHHILGADDKLGQTLRNHLKQ
jgi:hypothetical protein